jgi:hypothetical protein
MRQPPLVSDCGMTTQARVEEDMRPARLDWITALRARQIRPRSIPGSFSSRGSMSAILPGLQMTVPRCQS